MNRLFFFVVALSFVITVAIAQSDEDSTNASSENVIDSDDVDSVVDTATDTFDSAIDTADEAIDSAIDTAVDTTADIENQAQAQEEQLNEAISDMMTYFSKSSGDMSSILEDIKNVSEDNSDIASTNLVENLMSYAEDTKLMTQQIQKVMGIRARFQALILEQLYSLPISTEDAKKLENELREQIMLRADRIPNMQNMMDYPQRPPRFIPRPFQFIPN